jgi:hypothetical protein
VLSKRCAKGDSHIDCVGFGRGHLTATRLPVPVGEFDATGTIDRVHVQSARWIGPERVEGAFFCWASETAERNSLSLNLLSLISPKISRFPAAHSGTSAVGYPATDAAKARLQSVNTSPDVVQHSG